MITVLKSLKTKMFSLCFSNFSYQEQYFFSHSIYNPFQCTGAMYGERLWIKSDPGSQNQSKVAGVYL